jgi:hypothetical protein
MTRNPATRARTCAAVAALAAVLTIGIPAQRDNRPRAATPRPVSRLLLDQPAPDTVHALAPSYKVELTSDAVTFTPYFGAHAPRNFPVAMRLRGMRRGDRALPLRR